MRSTLRRTWAEVSLDAIEHNYKALRARIGENVKFLGVVKADAYGHGAVHVARTLQELGADYLAVSSLDEAMELRANGIVMPILILGHTPTEQVPNLIANNITQTVTCLAKAHEYNAAAAEFGAKLRVHIKVDTGMSRPSTIWNARRPAHNDVNRLTPCAAGDGEITAKRLPPGVSCIHPADGPAPGPSGRLRPRARHAGPKCGPRCVAPRPDRGTP